ncbi:MULTISPECIES: hypothetical protein [unclassified Synechococcus]|nr:MULTISPECIES: hypothetical protein [unclassified Synechococcus]
MVQQLAASAVLLDVDTSARQALAMDPALMLGPGLGRACRMSDR